MIKITDEDKEVLKPFIDNIEEKIKGDNIDDFLDEIDILIVSEGIGEDDEPTDFGYEIQAVFDRVYCMNN